MNNWHAVRCDCEKKALLFYINHAPEIGEAPCFEDCAMPDLTLARPGQLWSCSCSLKCPEIMIENVAPIMSRQVHFALNAAMRREE